MLNILLMIILIIILFIIILLALGIRVSLLYEKKGSEIKGCLKILIFKKIKIYSSEFPKEDEKEEKEEEEEKKERDLKKILELAKPCFEDIKIYIRSFLESLNVSKLENHLVFGLSSYAKTGKYIGMIWGFLSMANTIHPKARLSAEPSFNGFILDAKGNNEIELKPLKLVVPTIKFISNKDVRLLIKGVLNERS